jgi:hypothetical protein
VALRSAPIYAVGLQHLHTASTLLADLRLMLTYKYSITARRRALHMPAAVSILQKKPHVLHDSCRVDQPGRVRVSEAVT